MTTARAALVTGASSGIGLAIARMLAEEGHAVTLVARDPARLEQAATEIAEAGGAAVHTHAADVADERQLRTAFAAHTDRFGRLDVLVNNAGVAIGRSLGQVTGADIDTQMDVNLRAVVLAYRHAAPLLADAAADAGSALVLNVASVAGRDGAAWLSVYAATKAAVIAFSRSMQKELGRLGVKSVAVCPGFVDTPFTDVFKSRIPPETMLRASDVAALCRPLLHLSAPALVPEIVLHTA
jgi:NAD(P)-dependent dehydrogenase (short-subunit alcohol dehydrogenase family)